MDDYCAFANPRFKDRNWQNYGYSGSRQPDEWRFSSFPSMMIYFGTRDQMRDELVRLVIASPVRSAIARLETTQARAA